MSVLYHGIFSAAQFQKILRPLQRPVDKHFSGPSCYILFATMANVDEHFWLFHKLSTNTFLRLEVSRGKYPIIKYMEFLAAIHSSKWELFVVPYNFEHLDIYEGKLQL